MSLPVYRKQAGFTQKGLANAAGLTQGAIFKLEGRTENPGIETLRKIANALNATGKVTVSVDDIWPTKTESPDLACEKTVVSP